MSRFHSYLNTAVSILSRYKGEEPFAAFAKGFFAADKKYGSGDRKMISQLCYHYFRAIHLFPAEPTEQQIIKAHFLCSEQTSPLLEQLEPGWNQSITGSFETKWSLLGMDPKHPEIFPFNQELSEGIDEKEFGYSHLKQPHLFLRIRPGQHTTVIQKLTAAGLSFQLISENCLALPNGSKIESVLLPDQDVVVQDASSQEAGELLRLIKKTTRQRIRVWDCCAASGGKSIMSSDILGEQELVVSDLRESILANLVKRFRVAGMQHYQVMRTDLSAEQFLFNRKFDLIIADVPCSGSGTWGRTPEQLLYFQKEKIKEYAVLQKKIVRNAARTLQAGGYFLYITCSVFKQENEETLDYLQKELRLDLVKAQLIKGYHRRSDTMFAALLQKSSESD